ncbi:MAG: hypothetical protein ACK5JR_21265 [Tropicimonas sp.]|uniref:hypothetical protein n=1 Tax=Tropicimonas sp. TaxID=2067044 RepID=UPI003A864CC0
MKVRNLLAGLLLACLAFQVGAQVAPVPSRSSAEARERVAPLMEALGAGPLLEIVREEGLANGEKLGREMFAGAEAERWAHAVSRIYDIDRMAEILLDGLATDIDPDHLDPLLEFFGSALGRRIVALEIAARRALLEPEVKAASGDYLMRLRAEGGERLALLEQFADRNDLVDANVSAALNANLAFFSGLRGEDAPGLRWGEGEVLRDIWQQEEAIRDEIAQWVMTYLSMAFQPLSNDELKTYIAFTGTAAGRGFNTGLFVSFNALFQWTSNQMGQAAAGFLRGETL